MKYLLFFQGIYYSVMGLWAILSGDFFLKYTNGVLFLLLGVLFFHNALRKIIIKQTAFFGLLTALGLMAVKVNYLSMIGNPIFFWIDFGIEGAIVSSFLILFIKSKVSD